MAPSTQRFKLCLLVLLRRSIAVACIQETHAPDFASLPDDQPYRYDGPSSVGGSEAGFLFHESVTTATIPELPDAQRIQWRLVGGLLGVCSYSAPHGGMNAHFRTRVGEELVASVRHTQRTLPRVPIVIAPCFHFYTSFSKVVVFVFGTTSRGPHTLLERLSIWSSLLWHSGQEVSLCIKVTSVAP